MKKKICVYTCITGDYDTIHEIENKESGVDYLLFTNNKTLKSNTWNIIYIEDEHLDNQRLSRKIKMLGDPIIDENYDVSLWMDASVVFKTSIKEFIKKYYNPKKAPFSSFRHHARNCIYEEATACIKSRKDTKENIEKHIKFLKKEKYPENNGLYEMTVFIKEHNHPLVKETMKLWFEMVCTYSKRDQLSFMYCVWKTGMPIHPINLNVMDNKYFLWIKHNHEKEIKSCRIVFCKEEDYCFQYDRDYNYKIKANKYVIDLKIPCETNYIRIEPLKTPCVIYKNLEIKNIKKKKIRIINSINYHGNNIFYNNVPIIEIEEKFCKGDVLHFEVEYQKMSIDEVYNLMDYLGYSYQIELDKNFNLNQQLATLERVNKDLSQTLNSIITSRGWKLLEKLRKLKPTKKK